MSEQTFQQMFGLTAHSTFLLLSLFFDLHLIYIYERLGKDVVCGSLMFSLRMFESSTVCPFGVALTKRSRVTSAFANVRS